MQGQCQALNRLAGTFLKRQTFANQVLRAVNALDVGHSLAYSRGRAWNTAPAACNICRDVLRQRCDRLILNGLHVF